MSISMEKFASEGHFATFDPLVPIAARVSVITLQCRCCGFEPEDAVVAFKLLTASGRLLQRTIGCFVIGLSSD
jgi:hypothetical protein